MSNLVTSLGRRYVNDYFNMALFQHEGKVYKLHAVLSNTEAEVATLSTRRDEPYWDVTRVPLDYMKDFTSFAVPRLGYRTVEFAGNQLLLDLQHQRSTRRGFRLELVRSEGVPISTMLFGECNEVFRAFGEAWQANLCYFPKFDTVKSGINKLLAAETTAVALSPDMAIVLDVEQAGDIPFSILYRGTRIGTVDDDSRIRINNKAVSRESFRRHTGL